jgi:hypothetical protein
VIERFFLREVQQDVDKNFAYVAVMLSNILNITHSNEGFMSSMMAPKETLSSHTELRIRLPGAGRSDVKVPLADSGLLQILPGTRRKTTTATIYDEADP